MIFSVLGNVFSMRIIGNKTHGDLAEIALTEYINRFVDGFTAKHTGKEKFRAKEFEEDIRITETSTKEEIPISIKTYGFGPLQLSTNKDVSMFSLLQKEIGKRGTGDVSKIKEILDNNYIFEVRYGDAKANALQRGMWTHTENAEPFFKKLLIGGYKINKPLITLIAKILVSRKDTHEKILQYF